VHIICTFHFLLAEENFQRWTILAEVHSLASSAKGVTLWDSPSSDKNRKVHKMCARYHEIPDIKFRRELGFGPIDNWFNPASVLLAVMLPPPI
jgi:hypothetical protein